MTVERNKRIVALRDQGWSFNDISREVGISVGRVNMLYYTHCRKDGDGIVPEGMSVLTARHIAATMGFWPSADNAAIIAKRAMELMRGRRRVAMMELGAWLDSLGLPN